MSYLDLLPSYDSLKGYCTDGVNYLSKQYDHYYPIVKEGTVKYGKPAVIYIHAKAVEHPIPALIVANLGLIVLAKKIAGIASYILNKLTCGIAPRRLTAFVTALGLFAGANYGIYRYVNLNLSLEASIAVPAVTFAAFMILNKFVCRRSTRVSAPPLLEEKKMKQNSSNKVNNLKRAIAKEARLLTEDQKEAIKSQFKWWNPENKQSLDSQGSYMLSKLLNAIKNPQVAKALVDEVLDGE